MTGKTGARGSRCSPGPGDPGRPVGRQRGRAAVRQGEEGPPLPAQDPEVLAGPPVDLSRFYGQEPTPEVLREAATEAIMAAVTDLLGASCAGSGARRRAVRPPQGRVRDSGGAAAAGGGHQVTRSAVFGTGSWGTAFAMVLADAGCEVTLWGRRAGARRGHQHHAHQPRLPARARAARSVRATTDPPRPPAAPSSRPRRALADAARQPRRLGAAAAPPTPCWSRLMKGVELGTAKRMSEVIEEVAKVGAGARRRASPGPTWPRRSPTGSRPPPWSPAPTRRWPSGSRPPATPPYFRPYTNTDVVGCELGGAVKNVIGLAVGIADGMGLGDNAKGSLITRGLAETTRLGVAMGADPLTFAGLAGLGDLVATCSSPLSRNHTFGTNLGRGMTPGGDHRGHQADRRGRQVLRVGGRSGPAARRRHADHGDGRGHRAQRQAAGGRAEGTDVAQREARTSLTGSRDREQVRFNAI